MKHGELNQIREKGIFKMTSRDVYSNNEKTFYRPHGGFRGVNETYGSHTIYGAQVYTKKTLPAAKLRPIRSHKKSLESRLRGGKK